MSVETINTLVVGAGQAGVAMSEHLSLMGVPHIVLERHRIAERWRSERWDSLVANGPAWHDRFPGLTFEGISPEAFPPKERMADYFEAYVKNCRPPCAPVWKSNTWNATWAAPASKSPPPQA